MNYSLYLNKNNQGLLEKYSKITERKKSYFVNKALEFFFQNKIEDLLTDEEWFKAQNIDYQKENFTDYEEFKKEQLGGF